MKSNSISKLIGLSAAVGTIASFSCANNDDDNNPAPNNPVTGPGTGVEAGVSPTPTPPIPVPTITPGPMPPTPAPSLWSSLTLETVPTSSPPPCSEEREFSVTSNNRWEFEHCEIETSGALHRAERVLIDQLTKQTLDGGGQRQCVGEGGADLELKLRQPNGQEVDLWEKGSTQTCFRGRRGATEALLNYLQSLENKYALRPTPWPSATPTSTPSATPTATPPLTPTPFITPTATPIGGESPTPTATPVVVPPPPIEPGL